METLTCFFKDNIIYYNMFESQRISVLLVPTYLLESNQNLWRTDFAIELNPHGRNNASV